MDDIVIKATVAKEIPLTESTSDVINVFYHALLENDMDVVKDVVVNQKVDINLIFKETFSYVQPWHREWGAIHIVTKRAIVESLKFIIELGADVNLENKHGDNALHIASKYGLVDCVEYLLQCNIELKDKQNIAGLTPLIKAVFKSEHAFRGQFRKTIQLLLDSGADPNICPVSGITPLHLAASKADEILIQLLLTHGAKVNAVCSQGTSPLLKTLLLRHQKSSCVKILLDAGADVNISTVAGRTALHLAVAKSENECVLNILEANANPNAQDKYGKTPLWIAVQENNVQIVELLSKFGGNVNYQLPIRKLSLLSLAISEGLSDMVCLLLNLGASIFTETVMGATPLYIAVQTQSMQIIKSLLKANCDLDVVSNARHSLIPQTPIQVAIEIGNLEVIHLLLCAGCKMKPGWIHPLISPLSATLPTNLANIQTYLKDYLSHVRSLKTLCRDSIRIIMKENIHSKMDALVAETYIPARLADFVLLTDLIQP
ncbi:hypothetical protein SNE40_016598 [Patella caerulea]|uniref:Uncharacterized protein n=1 Tax=Patella caerulea TaxID=87958 RepID=A0AAN8P8E6_PATCE